MQNQDQYFMSLALSLAQRAFDMGEVPVGAVLVKSGDIVGEGWNQPIAIHDPSAHAEIVALRDAARRLQNYRLPNTTLYVTIEPCSMCVGAIVHARVERIVFGALEPKAGAITSRMRLLDEKHWNHEVVVEGGVLAESASELMSSFFKMRRQQIKEAKIGQNNDRGE